MTGRHLSSPLSAPSRRTVVKAAATAVAARVPPPPRAPRTCPPSCTASPPAALPHSLKGMGGPPPDGILLWTRVTFSAGDGTGVFSPSVTSDNLEHAAPQTVSLVASAAMKAERADRPVR